MNAPSVEDEGAFVVESPAIDQASGERHGTFRVYVGTEDRARELVAERPSDRTYRAIRLEDMPAKARLSLEQARARARAAKA